ncbi:MAG TPA: hypothetical protein VGJ34_03800 [Gaiellaceae bacterium]|jgi:hypothetical protein
MISFIAASESRLTPDGAEGRALVAPGPLALGGLPLAVTLVAIPVGVAVGAYAGHVARAEVGRAAALLTGVALAAGIVLFPLQLGRAVERARDGLRVNHYRAERAGPDGRGFDVALVDRVAAIVPRDATYYMDARGPGKTPLRFWAYDWLLPRIAVDSAAKADWVVSWHSDPHALGVRYESLRRIGPRTWVGRVAR